MGGTRAGSNPRLKKVTIHWRKISKITMQDPICNQMFSLRFIRHSGTIRTRATNDPVLMISIPEKGLAEGSCSVTQIAAAVG